MAYEKEPPPNSEAGFKEAERRIEECLKLDGASGGLDLSGLNLITLPRTMRYVEMLLWLNLSGNQLKTLPLSLYNRGALQWLDVSNNRLTKLPEEIAQLYSIQELKLQNNRLTKLPTSIGDLGSLEQLNLEDNLLTSIPESIGNLRSLRGLFLSNNRLSTLPENIGYLYSARALSISNNCISRLPESICQLGRLQKLELRSNHLTALPESIGNLEALIGLDLENNQLNALPESIAKLQALHLLHLRGNPGLGLSEEMLSQTPQTLLNHYFALQKQGAKPLNEVRMVFVGRGGAGKTSLVQRLVRDSFDPRQPETPGVALSDWVMKDCKGEPVTAHLWDFAGQVITHTMHRYFLGQRTIYLLVLTQREDNAMEDADNWLKLIQSYGTERSADGTETGPPVVVALNKWSQAKVKVDREALRERFPFILDFIETDCETGLGIKEMRQKLCDLMDAPRVKPWVRQDYPAQWRKLKERLIEEQKTKPHLSYPDFKKLCADCGVEDVEAVGRDLHVMGIALNYGLDPQWKTHLSDLTVLRPNWVTHHCYSLVRHAEKRGGLLYRAEVPDVLGAEREGVKSEKDTAMHWYLMRLMERFEVAYPLEQGDSWPPVKWLIPLGLEDNQPKGVADFSKVPPEDATRLRYRYPSVPPGLIAQFMVRTHPFEEPEMHWASGTVLTLKGARALVRVVSKTQIEITAIAGDKDSRRDLAGVCRDEIRHLNQQIKALDVVEETEVLAEGEQVWMNVRALEKDEKNERPSYVTTDEGTLPVDPTKELDEFGTKEARTNQKTRAVVGRVGEREFVVAERSLLPYIFISYSHRDEKHLAELRLHLIILKNLGLIEDHWHDRRIQPGMDGDRYIQTELAKADVVLFLTSTASLASDYINNEELRPALERYVKGEARVVPIILEKCAWVDVFAASPLLAIQKDPKRRVPQGIPRDGVPIRSFKPQSDGWAQVEEELKSLFTEIKAKLQRG